MLAQGRADVLECLVNGKHGDHSSHLHPRHTARDAGPGQGLWSSRGLPYYPMKVMEPIRIYAGLASAPDAEGTIRRASASALESEAPP